MSPKSKEKQIKVDVFMATSDLGHITSFDTIWRVPAERGDGVVVVKYMGKWHKVNDYNTGFDSITI